MTTPQRRAIQISGQVQGVGFRPFVYRLAVARRLSGFVRNDGAGVTIEIQGAPAALERLSPRPASTAAVGPHRCARHQRTDSHRLEPAFVIAASDAGAISADITPDTAVCEDCLAELFDPGDRRYRYPFVNCTNCGPCYTITAALPYDRPNTSMAGFRPLLGLRAGIP